METQCQRLLSYLQKNKTINPLLGIYRLGARIFDLRERHDIVSHIIKVKNQFGEECRVAEYIYMGEK